MNSRSLPAALLVALLAVGASSAVTVASDGTSGPYAVGDSFIVKADFTFDCIEEESLTSVEYTATIVNADDYDWLNASEADVTYDPTGCIAGGGSVKVEDVEINVTISGVATAFTSFDLQPGLVEADENDEGNFSIEQEYVASFTAPSTLTVNVDSDEAMASIGLSYFTNAASTFTFDVTDAPEGATVHIAESLAVFSSLDDGPTTASIGLHFGDHEEHEEGDEHMDEEGMAEEHAHWSEYSVTVSVALAADEDSTQAAEAQDVVITFVNTNPETMPHQDGDDEDDEGSNFLPGFEVVALIAALGAVLALRRRN